MDVEGNARADKVEQCCIPFAKINAEPVLGSVHRGKTRNWDDDAIVRFLNAT